MRPAQSDGAALPAPVVVTGMHRSGTTWLARMLCAGGDFIRIGEPLSVSNRQTVLPSTVDRWYAYITDANEADYLRWFQDAVAFRVHPILDLKRAKIASPRDPFRIGARWTSFTLGRAQRRRLLVHDPFTVFSIDWFVRRLRAQVVVTVRHPLAVVSSLKRLSWPFEFANLLEQPLLMAERLEPYRAEMEAAARSTDPLAQASLLWRIVYEPFARQQAPAGVIVVRHEDLSLDPVGEYERLYARLGLAYTADARETIERSTSTENRTELPLKDPDGVRLDSRANLRNWRHRLEDDEIERIVETTRPVAERFYPGVELYGDFAVRGAA